MPRQRTLSIIKPDATRRKLTEVILNVIKASGLTVISRKTLRLTRLQAEDFYAVHRGRPFFDSLCEFMSSGIISVQILEGQDAVAEYRRLMGATDPAEAAENTLRKRFAESLEANSVHGSDSVENARREIEFFFLKPSFSKPSRES